MSSSPPLRPRTPRPSRLGWLLAIWLPALGCISVSGGQPDLSMQTYIFEPAAPRASSMSPAAATLLVAPPSARAGFNTRNMLYTEAPAQLSQYAYSQWADMPSRMLEPLLVRAMEVSGAFESVVDISSGVLADVRLDTELVTLRQEFAGPVEDGDSGSDSTVRIVLRARAIDVRARRLLATRTFEATERAPTPDARGGVTATNLALSELLEQVSGFGREVARSYRAER